MEKTITPKFIAVNASVLYFTLKNHTCSSAGP